MDRVVVCEINEFTTDGIHGGLGCRRSCWRSSVTCIRDGARCVQIGRGRGGQLGFKIMEDGVQRFKLGGKSIVVSALQGGDGAMCFERAT